MIGACSNQIVKCIVYSSNKNIGKEKLLMIEKEKNKLGIKTSSRIFGYHFNEISFYDGEEWILVNPKSGIRGYRWRKAYVDAKNTSVSDLHCNILPYGGLYKLEEEKYFNW